MKSKQNRIEKKIKISLFGFVVILFLFYKFGIITNEDQFKFNDIFFVGLLKFPENADKFGQLGDYFGGILNPILSSILIYIALNNYKNDKNKERELEQKANFLKLNDGYSRLLDKDKLNKFIFNTKGNKKFEDFFDKFTDIKDKDNYDDDDKIKIKIKNDDFINILLKSDKAYELHSYLNFNEYAPLLRTTYHLLKDELSQDGLQKWGNIKIFRAQLSENELILMALNVLIDKEGQNGLLYVAEKTGLFKHLKHEKLKSILEYIEDSNNKENINFFKLKPLSNHYKTLIVQISD